jgi:hypothetical protein
MTLGCGVVLQLDQVASGPKPLVSGAEVEGFEPPVPSGTLAFKMCDVMSNAVRQHLDQQERSILKPTCTGANEHE